MSAAWQYVGRRGYLDAGEHGPMVEGAVRGATGAVWPRAAVRHWAMEYNAERTGVLQGHVDYCADFGHAYAVELGRTLSSRCGRCLAELDAATLERFRADLVERDVIDAPVPAAVIAAGVQLGMVLASGIESAYAAAPDELGQATTGDGGAHGSLVSAEAVAVALRMRSRAAGSASGLFADLDCGGVWFGWLDALDSLTAGCSLMAHASGVAWSAEEVAGAVMAAAALAGLDGVDTGGELVQWIARGDRRVLDYLPRSVALVIARDLGAVVAATAWQLSVSAGARAAVFA